MAGFTFDDGGAFGQLAGRLAAAGVKAGARAFALTQRFGVRLQAQVKANAAGRPGPRMVTGDYNRSIGLTVGRDGGAIAARVGTTRPQGRRLEFGFHGTDSRGRTYNQAPYPHFGPALDKVGPEFEKAAAELGADTLDLGGR